MKIVLDTNIIISSFINPKGIPREYFEIRNRNNRYFQEK
jgi:predicted nucleic acid-binding protein